MKINDKNCQGLEWRMNILCVDHLCIHSDLWESYTLGIFPYINLFVNVFLVRTWNLLHMDVDTISKDQIGVFSKMHNIPFHSLLPNGLLCAMGFTYPPWNWLYWIDRAQQNIERIRLYSHSHIYNVFFLNHSTILGFRWNYSTYSTWWLALI